MLSVSRLLSGVLLGLSFSVAGCSAQPVALAGEREIASIGMWLLPPDGGMAFCSFEADGATHCGHLSGDAVPFVHESRTQTGPAAIAEIWQAGAAAVAAGELIAGGQGKQPGHTQLYVVLGDGRQLSASWPFRKDAPGLKARRLGDLVEKHHIPGSW